MSRLRGLVLFVLLGAVILMTTALSAVGTVAANVAAFLIGFRVLTART